MMTPRSLAVVAMIVGSTSLALAQGAGIAPSGANLPAQTNLQGFAEPSPGASVHVKKSHHRLYMSVSKKKGHATSKVQ